MSLLHFDAVSCRRGGRTLFDDLDLRIEAGDAVLLTGPNGCGKSSLLRLACGLLDPAGGTIARASVALADDHLALDREQTLGAAVRWWARLEHAEQRCADALAAFGLTDLAAVPVRLLSTGQARRARLARVVASGAQLWLLDEPLNGLDRTSVALLAAAIERHRGRGGGVLAASHVRIAGSWCELALAR